MDAGNTLNTWTDTIPPSFTEASSDYSLGTTSLTFSANALRRCAGISITPDSRVENNETFTLELTTFDDDVTLGTSMATVSILNDDGKPTLAGIVRVITAPTHTHTHTAVTVSLEQGTYSVDEDDGSLMVCAAITGGQIDPGVLLPLRFSSPVGGTASKWSSW